MESDRPEGRRRFQFGLRDLMVAVAVVALLLGLLMPAINVAREAARKAACMNHLKQLGLAMHNIHDLRRRFPPDFVTDSAGRPALSWRVLVHGELESAAYVLPCRMEEPWNGPNNRKVTTPFMRAYHCPSDLSGEEMASYLAVVGPETAWPGQKSTCFADFRDGTANTILLVEAADSGIHWMEPRDREFKTFDFSINSRSGRGTSSYHGGGVNVLFADGSVRFLPETVAPETLRALLTIAGGERVDLNGF